ncbi:Hypothetical predicted protein, partial [Olea europaea subsp. europaea]
WVQSIWEAIHLLGETEGILKALQKLEIPIYHLNSQFTLTNGILYSNALTMVFRTQFLAVRILLLLQVV